MHHLDIKLVGMEGLEPSMAVRPGDLQSPAIAAMRHTQIKLANVSLSEYRGLRSAGHRTGNYSIITVLAKK